MVIIMTTKHPAKTEMVPRMTTSMMCFGQFTTPQNPDTGGVRPPNSVAMVGPSDLHGLVEEISDAPTGAVNEERNTISVGCDKTVCRYNNSKSRISVYNENNESKKEGRKRKSHVD
jgi:hypothetical protein